MYNYQEKYIKYKIKYLNLLEKLQFGGAKKNKTIPNRGRHMENGRKYSVQCFWISIMHFLRYVLGINITLSEIKRIAGMNGALVNPDNQEVNVYVYRDAILNIRRYFRLNIFIHSINNISGFDNIRTNIESIDSETGSGYRLSNVQSLLSSPELDSQCIHNVHILSLGHHFELLVELDDIQLYNHLIHPTIKEYVIAQFSMEEMYKRYLRQLDADSQETFNSIKAVAHNGNPEAIQSVKQIEELLKRGVNINDAVARIMTVDGTARRLTFEQFQSAQIQSLTSSLDHGTQYYDIFLDQGQAGTKGQPETKGQAGTKAQAGTKGQAGTEGQARTKGQSGTEGQARTKEQAGTKGQPETKGQAGTKGQPETKGQAGTESQARTKEQAGTKGQPETKGQAGTKGQPETKGQVEYELIKRITIELENAKKKVIEKIDTFTKLKNLVEELKKSKLPDEELEKVAKDKNEAARIMANAENEVAEIKKRLKIIKSNIEKREEEPVKKKQIEQMKSIGKKKRKPRRKIIENEKLETRLNSIIEEKYVIIMSKLNQVSEKDLSKEIHSIVSHLGEILNSYDIDTNNLLIEIRKQFLALRYNIYTNAKKLKSELKSSNITKLLNEDYQKLVKDFSPNLLRAFNIPNDIIFDLLIQDDKDIDEIINLNILLIDLNLIEGMLEKLQIQSDLFIDGLNLVRIIIHQKLEEIYDKYRVYDEQEYVETVLDDKLKSSIDTLKLIIQVFNENNKGIYNIDENDILRMLHFLNFQYHDIEDTPLNRFKIIENLLFRKMELINQIIKANIDEKYSKLIEELDEINRILGSN